MEQFGTSILTVGDIYLELCIKITLFGNPECINFILPVNYA